jgi:hypothetical protein
VFGPAEGIPFTRFDWVLPAEQDRNTYVAEVEEAAQGIVGAMREKEYLTWKSDAGTMPRHN